MLSTTIWPRAGSSGATTFGVITADYEGLLSIHSVVSVQSGAPAEPLLCRTFAADMIALRAGCVNGQSGVCGSRQILKQFFGIKTMPDEYESTKTDNLNEPAFSSDTVVRGPLARSTGCEGRWRSANSVVATTLQSTTKRSSYRVEVVNLTKPTDFTLSSQSTMIDPSGHRRRLRETPFDSPDRVPGAKGTPKATLATLTSHSSGLSVGDYLLDNNDSLSRNSALMTQPS